MRLSQFVQLRYARYQAAVPTAERIIRKYLAQFWGDENLPVPMIKLVKKMGVGWVARDVWRSSSPDNTTMELNVHLLESDDQLEKVIAHELIHHWQFLRKGLGAHSRQVSRLFGHGPDFRQWAAKINSVKGKDFVTEKSNEVTTQEVPEFTVLIKEIRPGTYGWMWAKRPSAKQQEAMRQLKERGWKQTTSTKYELSYGPKISPRGSYATTPLFNDLLEKLYQKAA
jgi:hypothetical protein